MHTSLEQEHELVNNPNVTIATKGFTAAFTTAHGLCQANKHLVAVTNAGFV